MRILSIFAFAATLPLVAMTSAGAETAQPSGAMPGTNMNAKCTAEDPEVLLDKASKTYTLVPSSKEPRGARNQHANTSGENSATAAIAASRNSAAQATMVNVCKSEADNMGAHMSANSANPANH